MRVTRIVDGVVVGEIEVDDPEQDAWDHAVAWKALEEKRAVPRSYRYLWVLSAVEAIALVALAVR